MTITALLGVARTLSRGWLALAIAAFGIVTTPVAPWRVLGPLTFSLLLGICVRAVRDRIGRPVSSTEDAGLRTMATTLLRVAVVVSALRLDWTAIARAGVHPWLVATIGIGAGLGVFALLGRWFQIRGPRYALIAIGTSVCGAAAITAAAPQVKASDEDVTVAIAVISVVGAVLAFALVMASTTIGLGGDTYALVTGGSLHEVAHVIAAASVVPAVAGLALLTKLARVALLPVGLALVARIAGPETCRSQRHRGVPGLAIAFFVTSVIGSIPGWLPGLPESLAAAVHDARSTLLMLANITLAISMAAIGLRMSPRLIARIERKLLAAAIISALALLGVVLLVSHVLSALTPIIVRLA